MAPSWSNSWLKVVYLGWVKVARERAKLAYLVAMGF